MEARYQNMAITVTKVLGTTMKVFRVWETWDGHTTMTRVNGKLFGRVGTRTLPDHIRNMEDDQDNVRVRTVLAWMNAQYADAYEVILDAYPELESIPHIKDMGEIRTTV